MTGQGEPVGPGQSRVAAPGLELASPHLWVAAIVPWLCSSPASVPPQVLHHSAAERLPAAWDGGQVVRSPKNRGGEIYRFKDRLPKGGLN